MSFQHSLNGPGLAGGCALEDGVRRAMHAAWQFERGCAPGWPNWPGAGNFSNLMCDSKRPLDSDILDLLERSHQTLSALAAAVEDPHRDATGWESAARRGRPLDCRDGTTACRNG